jgi:peroxiredoxin
MPSASWSNGMRSIIKQRKLITSVLILGMTGLTAGVLNAQGPTTMPAPSKASTGGKLDTADAATAWSTLRQSAAAKMGSAQEREAAARDVMNDLASFAKRYPGTDQAAFALLNHGMLAEMLKDFDTTDRSLAEAIQQTQNPRLRAVIAAKISESAIRPGKLPPAFTAKSIDGHDISPADFKGKVLLIDFWATWCGPCVAELSNVKEVYKTYHDKGLEIVSVSLDRDETTLSEFVQKQQMNWTQIYNGALPAGQDLATQYGVESIPHMILIGRNGKITAIDLRGPALGDAVREAVAQSVPPQQQKAAIMHTS